jgi:2-haloacid dehalogenase
MTATRRELLTLAASAAGAGLFPSAKAAESVMPRRFKAIAFDAFVIFDPRSISALAEELFPGKGARLSEVWRARQFEYGWLRMAMGRYADFSQITGDALTFAAKTLKIELAPEQRSRLMEASRELKPWPGVVEGLKSLRNAGVRLAFLSNSTPDALAARTKASGLEGLFEHQLSTDTIKTYKPDPRAYAMAVEAFALPAENILFAAFGGWDAIGAKAFGYPVFWFNPGHQPVEELGEVPDAAGTSFADLMTFLQA